jgi:hypothetical protein
MRHTHQTDADAYESAVSFTDLSADCAECGASLRTSDQHASGFCSDDCRRTFLANAEADLLAMLGGDA